MPQLGKSELRDDVLNKNNLKVVQICLEYVPSAGGNIITVMDIKRVFNTQIIAFTSADNMVHDQEWDQNVFRVPIRPGILGRSYSCPFYGIELQKAERILRQADLAIIHLLYRYHFQWAGAIAPKVNIPYWVIPHGGLDPYVFTLFHLCKRKSGYRPTDTRLCSTPGLLFMLPSVSVKKPFLILRDVELKLCIGRWIMWIFNVVLKRVLFCASDMASPMRRGYYFGLGDLMS